ncbi:hypothetical protein PENSUB_4555 [Penicillium subrubescens]|uniref:Uncharacterized protein n=1 Tax=Penicillium subrubescens TaxID=1316194 RepID=A0A1Q5UCB1_9EURO|nr:hypothetical protein PENSUB_4555 [Penicillium subrubescens]
MVKTTNYLCDESQPTTVLVGDSKNPKQEHQNQSSSEGLKENKTKTAKDTSRSRGLSRQELATEDDVEPSQTQALNQSDEVKTNQDASLSKRRPREERAPEGVLVKRRGKLGQ